jgi:hypothetical protein
VNTTICQAIQAKRILRFYYDNGYREVAPFYYGVGKDGNELLRAYQLEGASKSGVSTGWKLFSVNEISRLSITGNFFLINIADYNRKDPIMIKCFCKI